MFFDGFFRNKSWFRTFSSDIIVIFVLILVCCTGELTTITAQQTDIAILLPSTASGVVQGDVDYARSVSKRFVRMLNSIGFSADELQGGICPHCSSFTIHIFQSVSFDYPTVEPKNTTRNRHHPERFCRTRWKTICNL